MTTFFLIVLPSMMFGASVGFIACAVLSANRDDRP